MEDGAILAGWATPGKQHSRKLAKKPFAIFPSDVDTIQKEARMKAIGYKPIAHLGRGFLRRHRVAQDAEPKGRDILVEVKAISVNPVNYQVRGSTPPADGTEWKVLGWDVAEIVGGGRPRCSRFKVGEEDCRMQAPSLGREQTPVPHLVDERIVEEEPSKIGWADAAALPLTSLTGMGGLLCRLRCEEASSQAPLPPS